MSPRLLFCFEDLEILSFQNSKIEDCFDPSNASELEKVRSSIISPKNVSQCILEVLSWSSVNATELDRH